MILVVESQSETRQAMERLLSFHGYRVRGAASIAQAAELAPTTHPAIWVVNEVLMKEPPNHSQVVTYAAHEPPDTSKDMIHFGARDWLSRAGVRWSELLPRIEQAFARATPLSHFTHE